MSCPRPGSTPHRGCDPRCDPRAVFELADGALGPEGERDVRSHLRGCPGCRGLYEREVSLGALLGAAEFEGGEASVRREVVMALPTRCVGARLIWGALALALLVAALLALVMGGTNPLVPAADAVDLFRGFVLGVTDVTQTVFVVAGPTIVGALAVGAVLDLVIAAVVLAKSRRKTTQA